MPKINYEKFLEKHLKPLIGKKIVGIVIEAGSEEEFGEPIYGFRLEDGTLAFVLRDPEGNGPGHLEIQ